MVARAKRGLIYEAVRPLDEDVNAHLAARRRPHRHGHRLLVGRVRQGRLRARNAAAARDRRARDHRDRVAAAGNDPVDVARRRVRARGQCRPSHPSSRFADRASRDDRRRAPHALDSGRTAHRRDRRRRARVRNSHPAHANARSSTAADSDDATTRCRVLVVVGLVGFVSGLLGNSGGFLLAPLFMTALGLPIHRAFGTSLVLATCLAVPGTIVHAWLGHIDWTLTLAFGFAARPQPRRRAARIADQGPLADARLRDGDHNARRRTPRALSLTAEITEDFLRSACDDWASIAPHRYRKQPDVPRAAPRWRPVDALVDSARHPTRRAFASAQGPSRHRALTRRHVEAPFLACAHARIL